MNELPYAIALVLLIVILILFFKNARIVEEGWEDERGYHKGRQK
jgi:hypothetical protein